MTKIKNSDNGINWSNSLIGIKLLPAQSDPIKRCPLYKNVERVIYDRFSLRVGEKLKEH